MKPVGAELFGLFGLFGVPLALRFFEGVEPLPPPPAPFAAASAVAVDFGGKNLVMGLLVALLPLPLVLPLPVLDCHERFAK